MSSWELARLRVKEADKISLESQRVYQALAARKNAVRHSKRALLSAKILRVKGFILQLAENLYCRTLGFLVSRSGQP